MATSPAAAPKWLTKQEAANILGLSTREVERMAQHGRITKRYNPPGVGKARYGHTLYLETDILAIDHERDLGIHNTKPVPIAPALHSAGALALIPQAQAEAASAQTIAWGALTTHLAKLTAALPSKEVTKKWLTFDEAAEYSGLPKAKLAELLRAKKVYCFGRGPKSWTIQRASLDVFGDTVKLNH